MGRHVLTRMAVCVAVAVLCSCGGESSDKGSSSSTTSATPRVGETWYVRDHAYTDEVYATIQQTGTETWPAQTSGDNPDKSFHLIHPYPCKVTDVHDDGFYKCDVDSDNSLDVKSVWTNRLMSRDQAEADSPGAVIHTPAPVVASRPSWLKIKRGAKLFTGYDGGDATTVTVCGTRSAYKDNASGGETKCTSRKPGIRIHVISSSDDYSLGDGTTNTPVLQIAADDGSWSGYTGSLLQVQPRIPPGTKVKTEQHTNAPTRIWNHKGDAYQDGIELEGGTTLEILRQDPTDPQNSDLYVTVVTGRYAGKRGWTLSSGLEVLDGSPMMLEP